MRRSQSEIAASLCGAGMDINDIVFHTGLTSARVREVWRQVVCPAPTTVSLPFSEDIVDILGPPSNHIPATAEQKFAWTCRRADVSRNRGFTPEEYDSKVFAWLTRKYNRPVNSIEDMSTLEVSTSLDLIPRK